MPIPKRPPLNKEIPNGPFSYLKKEGEPGQSHPSTEPINFPERVEERSLEAQEVMVAPEKPKEVVKEASQPAEISDPSFEKTAPATFPQKPVRGQRYTDSKGVEWEYEQPRDENGTFLKDNPETPDKESAYVWVLVNKREDN